MKKIYKDKSLCDIELKSEVRFYMPSYQRKIKWRIVPSELPWYKRIFNGWQYLFRSYTNIPEYTDGFSANDFHNLKKSLRTVQDIREYIAQQAVINRMAWKELYGNNGDWGEDE